MSEISVRFEREQIEITQDGTFGGEPDYMRKFIPGLGMFYVTINGEELPPMTPEQFEIWKESTDERASILEEATKANTS